MMKDRHGKSFSEIDALLEAQRHLEAAERRFRAQSYRDAIVTVTHEILTRPYEPATPIAAARRAD